MHILSYMRFGQAGMDYKHLKDLLADGDFQKADDETRILLIKLAGTGAVERKWVYFTEVSSHEVYLGAESLVTLLYWPHRGDRQILYMLMYRSHDSH